jgi:predicted house-cleaning noncanonical NTP pyrophosphatase (MazG superfamily)
MKVWNKLVRDRIPEIIEASGNTAVTETLDRDAFRRALLDKLLEEANELIQSSGRDIASEAADVLEVVEALCELQGISMNEVASRKAEKLLARGAFKRRILLIRTLPAP